MSECEKTIMSRKDAERVKELDEFGNYVVKDNLADVSSEVLANKVGTMVDLLDNIIAIRESYGLPSDGTCKDCPGDKCAMGINYKPIKEPEDVWFVGVQGKSGRAIKKVTNFGVLTYNRDQLDEMWKNTRHVSGVKMYVSYETLLRTAPLGTIVPDFDEFLREMKRN